jgi:hypothetical protein
MADLYNQILAQNTLSAKPTSNLGTRELQFFCLYAMADFWNGGNYTAPDSDYARAVRAIEEVAEIFFLGPPDINTQDAFVFAVAKNTTDIWYDEGDFTDVEANENNEPGTLYIALDNIYNNAFSLYQLNARGFGIV